jgi:hypothetical protein
MQYILSEAEFTELKQQQVAKLNASTERLQAICTQAAMHIPVPHEWADDKTPRPWGCILGPLEQNPGHCDDCPVSEICPYQGKEWSQ